MKGLAPLHLGDVKNFLIPPRSFQIKKQEYYGREWGDCFGSRTLSFWWTTAGRLDNYRLHSCIFREVSYTEFNNLHGGIVRGQLVILKVRYSAGLSFQRFVIPNRAKGLLFRRFVIPEVCYSK